MKAFLVYSGNNPFRLYMPYLEKNLSSLGYEVLEVVKEGKEGVDIPEPKKEWLKENSDTVLLLMDDACISGLNGFYSFVGEKNYLDSIFGSYCHALAVFGEEKFFKYVFVNRGIIDLEYAGRGEDYFLINTGMMIQLFRRAFKNRTPVKIYISKDKILDHGPLNTMAFNDQEQFPYEKFLERREKEEYLQKGSNKIKELVTSAGASVEMVEIISGELPKEKDQPDCWFIIDRHSRECPRFANRLRLPLGNLLDDLLKAKLLDVGRDEIVSSLEKISKILFQI